RLILAPDERRPDTAISPTWIRCGLVGTRCPKIVVHHSLRDESLACSLRGKCTCRGACPGSVRCIGALKCSLCNKSRTASRSISAATLPLGTTKKPFRPPLDHR